MVKDLTKGNPLKLILAFCLPMMLGQFFQQVYNLVDSIIVGRFAGTLELSAVGSTGSISFLVVGFVTGFTAGLGIPLSQAFGAGDYKKVRTLFMNSIYIGIAASVLLTVVTAIFVKPLLSLMQTPDSIITMAYEYISTIFLGLTATVFYNLFASVMRALGDSRTPLLLLIFSSVLNIILDLVFVIKLDMSCRGVGIATVIAQAVSALLALIIIIRKFTILKIEKSDAVVSLRLWGKLLYIGLPMALQMSITATGTIMMQSAVNALGDLTIAAVAIAGKIQLFLVLPAESIGMAMATYCGQNLGAKRMDRVRKGVQTSMLIALCYSVFAISVAYFLGGQISGLFVTDESRESVIALAAHFLRVCCMFYPILAVLFPIRNSIQGLGFSLAAMLAGVFELAARALMSFLVIPVYGFDAVCLTNPSAWLAADILLFPVFFFIYFRLKKKLSEESEKTKSA